jgi:hypothetical protein
LGYIARVTGMKIMPYYMMGFFVLMIVMVELAFAVKKKRKNA